MKILFTSSIAINVVTSSMLFQWYLGYNWSAVYILFYSNIHCKYTLKMDFIWTGFLLSYLLLQTRYVFAFPNQLERRSHTENQEIGIKQLPTELNGQQEVEANIHLSKDFKYVDVASERAEYLPETYSNTASKIGKMTPVTSLEQVIRRIIKTSNIPDNIPGTLTVINQRTNRVKRDKVNEICLTEKCLEVLRQYMEWRKQNGYPARTGVTSIG